MIRKVLLSIFLAVSAFSGKGAATHSSVTSPPTAEELAAGQALAVQLRSAAPTENSEFHGKLVIKSHAVVDEIPISCRVVINSNYWCTIYETKDGSSAQRREVRHNTNGPNQYFYNRTEGSNSNWLPIALKDASKPLAGSDFSLADLGMDFWHWPVQRRLGGATRLGQPCYVLESSRSMGELVRVKSYIDKDSGAPLVAEGYDGQSNLVKEFSLHGSSVKKINGRWQVQKVEMVNHKTHSRTELVFDPPQS